MPCGIDLDFTSLKDKLLDMKSSALAELNSTVAAARAVAESKIAAFESTIRGWVSEIQPPAPSGISMELDIVVLANFAYLAYQNPTEARSAALSKLRSTFLEKYGEALSKSGSNLDSLIEGLNSGIDPCSLLPNIVTDSLGNVIEQVKKPLYAKVDGSAELLSIETEVMKTLRSKIGSDIGSISFSTSIMEPKLSELPVISNVKDSVSKAIDITEYYSAVEKVEIIDLEMESLISSGPTTFKAELESIRQNV
jgi:hypothetical protein